MKKLNSLKGRSVFRDVLKHGAKLQDKFIRIYILRNHKMNRDAKQKLDFQEPGNPKIGILLSRYFGKAHERNRMRRRLKAICRIYIKCMKDNYLIVLRPERGFLALSFEEEYKILIDLLAKAERIWVQCK